MVICLPTAKLAIRPLAAAGAVLVVGLGLMTATAAAPARVVIELFTSQGCSSCPPADAFLGELAKRDDVIALTLPVDYWDYLGWKDTFASPAHSKRQRDYARMRGDRQVYTPQIVVNGREHVVGSQRSAVFRVIQQENGRSEQDHVAVKLMSGNKSIMVSTGAYAGPGDAPEATIWLLLSTRRETVAVQRGENRGHELSYYNVVRQMVPIGTWHGKAKEVELPKAELMEGYDGCTAILQIDGVGAILGAAHLASVKTH